MVNAAAVIIDLIIVLWTGYTTFWYFQIHRPERLLREKLHIFRYFTYLSNLLSAVISLIFLICRLAGIRSFSAPLLLLRYFGTASVTVTCLTVLFFLAPTVGSFLLYKEDNLYMHVIGPVLAVVSFIFLDGDETFSLWWALLGMLPVVLYAIVYFRQVIGIGEENGGWPDFYGFNQNGGWRISMVLMLIGSFLIAWVLLTARNAFFC